VQLTPVIVIWLPFALAHRTTANSVAKVNLRKEILTRRLQNLTQKDPAIT
jgi:hypothetical protein